MRKIERTLSLPAHVRNVIIDDILDGTLKPGDKITEEVYAEKSDVSRAPVREAILMLITEGIAHKIENRGTFLREFSVEEHIDLYDLRFFLEKEAIKKIEMKDDIEPLASALDKMATKMEELHDNYSEFVKVHYDFHHAIMEYSGSAVLMDTYPSYYITIHFIRRIDFEIHFNSTEKLSVVHHREIADGFVNRDFRAIHDVYNRQYNHIRELLKNYKD